MIELIYDNEAIVQHWEYFFTSNSLDYRLNDISKFEIDLEKAPDDIIYLNCTGRMNNYTNKIVKIEQYLDLLAIYNRKVINDFNTVNYSFSLVEQYRLFKRFGLTYPLIVFSSEKDELLVMAEKLPVPFQLISNIPFDENEKNIFNDVEQLNDYFKSNNINDQDYETLVLRQFIPKKENKSYRTLIIDNKSEYVYSIEFENKNVEIFTDIESLNQLLEKYVDMATNAGYKFVEVEFVKAKNNVIYTNSIKPSPIIHKNLESETGNTCKNALLNLLK